MIARLWLLLSCLWALAFLGNGLTKKDGVQNLDVGIAAAPFVIGLVLKRAGHFVVQGK